MSKRKLFREGSSEDAHFARIEPRALSNFLARSSDSSRILELMLVRASKPSPPNLLLVQRIRVAQSIILVVDHLGTLIDELRKSLRSSLLFFVFLSHYFDRLLFLNGQLLLLSSRSLEVGLIEDSLHVMHVRALQEVLE